MDYYMVGQHVRKMRKAKGLSQDELASKIGISTTHMSHIETGNTKLSLAVLVDIATALEVRTDDLLFERKRDCIPYIDEELQELMNSCSSTQAKIILDIVRSTKMALDKYY